MLAVVSVSQVLSFFLLKVLISTTLFFSGIIEMKNSLFITTALSLLFVCTATLVTYATSNNYSIAQQRPEESNLAEEERRRSFEENETLNNENENLGKNDDNDDESGYSSSSSYKSIDDTPSTSSSDEIKKIENQNRFKRSLDDAKDSVYGDAFCEDEYDVDSSSDSSGDHNYDDDDDNGGSDTTDDDVKGRGGKDDRTIIYTKNDDGKKIFSTKDGKVEIFDPTTYFEPPPPKPDRKFYHPRRRWRTKSSSSYSSSSSKNNRVPLVNNKNKKRKHSPSRRTSPYSKLVDNKKTTIFWKKEIIDKDAKRDFKKPDSQYIINLPSRKGLRRNKSVKSGIVKARSRYLASPSYAGAIGGKTTIDKVKTSTKTKIIKYGPPTTSSSSRRGGKMVRKTASPKGRIVAKNFEKTIKRFKKNYSVIRSASSSSSSSRQRRDLKEETDDNEKAEEGKEEKEEAEKYLRKSSSSSSDDLSASFSTKEDRRQPVGNLTNHHRRRRRQLLYISKRKEKGSERGFRGGDDHHVGRRRKRSGLCERRNRYPRLSKLHQPITVVTNNVKCTNLARSIVRRYPNISSIELWIIISLCEGIVHPMDSGLGGGFQMTLYSSCDGSAYYVNSREKSGKYTKYFPKDAGQTSRHIGVPSMLRGYQYLYNNIRDLGYPEGPTLPWSKLFEDAIRISRDGFPISQTFADVINRLGQSARSIWKINANGRLTNARLSNYLTKIASYGPRKQPMYTFGSEDNVQIGHELKSGGALITERDVASYKVMRSDALETDCLNYKVYTSRLPGSGFLQLFGCKLLERAIRKHGYAGWSSDLRFLFDLKALYFIYSLQPYLMYLAADRVKRNDHPRYAIDELSLSRSRTKNDGSYIFRTNSRDGTEPPLRNADKWCPFDAYKTGYYCSRSDTAEMPRALQRILKRDSLLIADAITKRIYEPIPRESATTFGRTKVPRSHVARGRSRERGTTNVCVSDGRVDLCATSTVNWAFGSGIYSQYFGFFYNNQAADFTYGNELSYNKPRADSYPQSSIAPTLFVDKTTGETEFQVGSAGGRKIVGSTFSVISELIYQRHSKSSRRRNDDRSSGVYYNCKIAQNKPRCIFHLKPTSRTSRVTLECENSLNKSKKRLLRKLDTLVAYTKEAGYSAVTMLNKDFGGCFDPRRGGKTYKQQI